MKFFTEIPIQQQTENLIDYQSKVLLLGSCFVENMGEKFDYYKFQNLQNPFGVLFQPKAIEQFIGHAVNDKTYTTADLFYHNDIWQSFGAHSKLSGLNQFEVVNGLNAALKQTKQFLESATHVIVTLGTAWVYRHKETDTVVANCHKVPQSTFKKELLSSEEVVKSLQQMLDLVATVNTNVQIVFTVSPIRHTKDGFIENTRSKSHLISAIHQLLNGAKTKQCHYFPSYEIMMDELRDYRFYTADLIHPNQIAIDYIWEKFRSTWFSSSTLPIMKEVHSIQNGLRHKPFNASSEQHKKFLKVLGGRIEALQVQVKGITFCL